MRRIFALSFAGVLFLAMASMSFADSFTFSDTVNTSGSLTWTHTLDNEDFDPNLSGGEVIDITSATLGLDVYITLSDGGSTEVTILTGDDIYLGNYAVYKDGSYTPSFVFNETALDALEEDCSMDIVMRLALGSSATVNSSTLYGAGNIISQGEVPIPSAALLLGSGLIAILTTKRRL